MVVGTRQVWDTPSWARGRAPITGVPAHSKDKNGMAGTSCSYRTTSRDSGHPNIGWYGRESLERVTLLNLDADDDPEVTGLRARVVVLVVLGEELDVDDVEPEVVPRDRCLRVFQDPTSQLLGGGSFGEMAVGGRRS
ncbi:hypothetical protein [Nannocystis radixulma]|uniref:Uncharacterized protein n=1 Tax=Nannocystis radixulma TaxID=2995305 RepID=A0ABT5BNW5_9BACT|nr:hypothetical protein [Nannocystis radixulma]MDC0675378.1 hypothetical protein [Nannocystis radixulma]